MLPAALLGWYWADLLIGLVHMYMDYRPCPAGKGLDQLFFYPGSRESDHYLSLLRERMAAIRPHQRIAYDFKNHHPRPYALGRRDLWRQIGSTVVLMALPMSLLGNLAGWLGWFPGWALLAWSTWVLGGGFAQYFHGTLHRPINPWYVLALRRCKLLMTPEAHQLHHDTLQRDFATNCGWSNPVVNRMFEVLRSKGYLKDEGLIPSA